MTAKNSKLPALPKKFFRSFLDKNKYIEINPIARIHPQGNCDFQKLVELPPSLKNVDRKMGLNQKAANPKLAAPYAAVRHNACFHGPPSAISPTNIAPKSISIPQVPTELVSATKPVNTAPNSNVHLLPWRKNFTKNKAAR